MTSDSAPTATRPSRYVFSNSAPEAARQHSAVEAYLDPITLPILAGIELRPGALCVDLGAGAGSVSRSLARRVGPTGRVLAVDLDPTRLRPVPNVQVVRHDLRRGLPALPGPVDLIHARLVLAHVPNRHELVGDLVAALAPGGWLVVGEFSGRHRPVVHTAADEADRELFAKVVDAFGHLLGKHHGVDAAWADNLHAVLADAGLRHVHTIEHAESWTGGEPGCQLHVTSTDQLRDRLITGGLTAAELDRFRGLMADPRFASRSWQFVCSRGRRPPAS